jgi:hypothetical protein
VPGPGSSRCRRELLTAVPRLRCAARSLLPGRRVRFIESVTGPTRERRSMPGPPPRGDSTPGVAKRTPDSSTPGSHAGRSGRVHYGYFAPGRPKSEARNRDSAGDPAAGRTGERGRLTS